MSCFVKNCYCIWSIALGGCPLEETREHNSLLYLSFLLCSWDFYYILCECSKILELSKLQVVSELFLGHKVGDFFFLFIDF
jgi:hypothetical protein